MLLKKEESIILLVDVQEKLTPFILDFQRLIEHCEWLLKLANQLAVPILVSEQYPQGLGHTVMPLAKYYQPIDCIEKNHFSCRDVPNYLSRLQRYNKNQLIVIGIEAHVCILETAMGLKDAGYQVYVVVDAVSSRKVIDLKYALKRMQQAGIHLITTEMIFFEWLRKAGTAEFKALSQEFLVRRGG